MKHLTQFITEYIIKKKLDKPIDSEHNYDYYPKTKDELIENLNKLMSKDIYDFNCIDTSKITDMSYLFKNILLPHNDKIYFNKWDVSNVKDMSYMFANCYYINPDLSCWDISKVENMEFMFNYCTNFKGKGLDNWKPESIIELWDMFKDCTSLKNKPSWYEE